ncbi:MAG: SusC/RagA family TonB-linked outer membrane protein [Chitinophagaceae bacterium]|nr:SusC/RagA family TonB-linked outer membrane protein [Chitinophagaceae bacterium]
MQLTNTTPMWVKFSRFARRSAKRVGGTKTLLIMKLLSLLLFVACLQVSATGTAQKITLSGKDLSIKKVLKEIGRQSGHEVIFTNEIFDKTPPVTIDLKDAELTDALNSCLKGKPFSYEIMESVIVVKPAVTPGNKIDEGLNDDGTPIKGVIRDAEGNPLGGINIVIKGTKRGVVSDAYGNFMIDANVNEVLVISSVNYDAKEIKVTGAGTSLVIALEKRISKLDEVEYIAYGTTSKRFTTSVTSTVTAKDIENQPISNPLLALQGRVPGTTVMQANGIAGGGVTIRIQGRNNLDHNLVGSDPFIVIDGVPYASQNLGTFKGGELVGDQSILGSSSDDLGTGVAPKNFGSPLAFINPADIESITVLRDADATAIYGSRAANGAILITTKRGKKGDIRTDINFQQGFGQVPKKMDLLNSQQYMEMRWEAKRNDGLPVTERDYDLRGVWDTTKSTDWQDVLIGETASYTRLTAGVSGGSNTFQYLVSSTYGRETTVFPGNSANTFGSLHFNLSASSVNQRFKIQLGGSYMSNMNKLPTTDYTNYALNLPPVAPSLYNDDGSFNWAPDPLTGSSTWYNPLWRESTLFETKTNNLISNGSISYRIIPGLELKSTFGFTSTTSDQFMAALDGSEMPEFREDRIRETYYTFNTSRTWIIEPQLTWQQKWGVHMINALAGTTFQNQNNDGKAFLGYGHSSDLLLRNMTAGTGIVSRAYDINEYKYNAIFGRVNYILREKYLLNFSARRDGSSRFGPESQFNNFWSVGAGWNISEEPFFANTLPFISFAKIRGSYGTTGNDQIGNYKFMSLFNSGFLPIPFQGVATTSTEGLPNPYLEWEETEKLQGGIDLGLLKDQIFITVNYYHNRTSNSLTLVNLPATAGFRTILDNLPALLENTGWEFTVSGNKKLGGVQWNSNLNLTIPRNKVIAFPDLENSTLKGLITIGMPLNVIKTFKFAGIDPLTGVPMVNNRYGEPTSKPGIEDNTVSMDFNPKWYGGWQNSFSYKGFSIDFLIQATRQKWLDVVDFATSHGYLSINDPYSVQGNQPASVMSRWQKPGDITNYQRYSVNGLSSPEGDYNYKDCSFVRLKNVSISYQFSGGITQKLKMQGLRLFTNMQNVLTFTKYKGLDPETLNLYSLPPLRVITFGLQATF